ncbi:MAG: hypothetical protein ACLGH3_05395 [Actinomycetota bacterium]
MTAFLPALILVVVVFGALYLRGGTHRSDSVQRGRAPHIFEETEVPADEDGSRWFGLLRGLFISIVIVAVTLSITFVVARPLFDQIIRFER